MDGLTTPGHRADRVVVVARVERHPAAHEQRLGRLGAVGQPLEQHRADQRPAHRPGRAVPVDRRPGVQEVGRTEARVRRGPARRRRGGPRSRASARRPARSQRPGAGRRAPGPGRRSVPGHRRAPVDAGHRPGLLADARRRTARPPRRPPSVRPRAGSCDQLHRVPGRRRVAGEDGRARHLRAAGPARPVPAGRAAVPTSATTTASPPATASLIAGASSAAGSGSAPWPSTTSSSTTDALRVGRLECQPLGAQRGVDHRMRPSLGQRVVAEVDHQMAARIGRAQVGAEGPLRVQRDVRADLAQGRTRDQHRLVAQRAAGVQPAQRATGPRRRRLVPTSARPAPARPTPRGRTRRPR